MGLYLCVCESSFVNAVENACIVEEIQLSLSCKLKSVILTSILASCEPKTVLYTGNSLPEPKTFV